MKDMILQIHSFGFDNTSVKYTGDKYNLDDYETNFQSVLMNDL